MEKILYYSGIGVATCAISTILYLFGVPKVVDPLQLTYKKDSKLMNKVLENTNLRNLSFTTCYAGTVSAIQMILMETIELFYLKTHTHVPFHREILKFKDGGQAAMDWGFEMPQRTKYLTKNQKSKMLKKMRKLNKNKKTQDDEKDLNTRPILLIILGMCSKETGMYVQNTCREGWARGYHPVLLQYRGMSGIKFTSPLLYGCGQYQDVIQAINHIHEEYCKEIDRKIFAAGFSLGGNWLGMALCKDKRGLSDKITASCCMECPTKVSASYKNMKAAWGGFINWALGKRQT